MPDAPSLPGLARSAAAAKGPTEPATTAQHGNSQKPSAAAAVSPLAPLEFLQTQRRGSITDPSLHAAGTTSVSSSSNLPPFRHPESAFQSRPPSAFRLGESSESNTLPHIRTLLRSPSAESVGGPKERRTRSERSDRLPGNSGDDRMEVDEQAQSYREPETHDRQSPEDTEVNGRRASLAGIKRKMSPDRHSATPGEIDPQLVGRGTSNEPGLEEPASKRRNSAFDTRIANLSITDRRTSGDARHGGGQQQQQWWTNEGREQPPPGGASNPGVATTPLTGYSTPSSGLPGDSPHGHPPGINATFAWPANPQPDQTHPQPPGQNEAATGMATNPPYDALAMVPQPPFPPDRRLSQPENMSTPSAVGPTRSRQTRSRPSSRRRSEDSAAGQSTNVIPEDGPSTSELQVSMGEKPGSTPYSRSPELRVSHKLAERKRRKEMKDLFDELRDQLPADRGMKASKWEILSKAIDFIVNLKQSHQDMSREIDMLRHEVESVRQGIPPFPAGGAPPMYHPPVGVPFHPPGPGAPPNSHPVGPPPPGLPPQQPPALPPSRPDSSQNVYPPTAGQSGTTLPPQNGNPESGSGAARADVPS
ncbi:hypothetical protein BXZ70DRAFT_394875 [Cristinia sonorae]|uniref:BHLH domain-containing protein n=1 Tax=Cristinia sonorae TaxID=1940300 RepID=A0A8K0UXX8_9AGAR|nr:hypothetical protein BXZ70DRAFT_394875 [Cristinia sonorae]